MQLYWCGYCKTVYTTADNCFFCGQPVSPFSSSSGQWRVFCSQGKRCSKAEKEQVLGRESASTALLFSYNSFVSKHHTKISIADGLVAVTDLNSPNGTFAESLTGDNTWTRVVADSPLLVVSGTSLLLSKECICRVWCKWIPERVGHIRSELFTRAEAPILLPEVGSTVLSKEVMIFCCDNRHFLKITGKNSQTFVNGNSIETIVLFLGDRINVLEKEYEYRGDRLVPVEPIYAPGAYLTDVKVDRRLEIKKIEFLENKFTGILGSSGAGKSTLLKVLTYWQTIDSGTVDITIGREKIDFAKLQKYLAYLPQYDILYENLKVKNALYYSALLKNYYTTKSDVDEQICHILSQVGLGDYGDSKVSQLSGGQRKRVNIASELLKEQASLLVLDEPTSGLDIYHDHRILQLLKQLCRQGRTVICTTHNLANISNFDRVTVIDKGKIINKGTPQEIAWQYNWSLTEPPEIEKESYKRKDLKLSPWIFSSQHWWILLCRRYDEFLHPLGIWRNLLSMLLVIPLFIGGSIALAWSVPNGEEKRFFLCSVAVFWLAMSVSSAEFISNRYRIFLHEKHNIGAYSYCIALLCFYLPVTLIQTICITSFSLYIAEVEVIWVFFGFVWAMAMSGALWGLNLSLCESRVGVPTSVSVPCLTVMQLLFSEMVMGVVLDSPDYFHLQYEKLRDICYILTFSRYPDMAYRSFHNAPLEFYPDFYYNLAMFLGSAIALPILILWILLATSRQRA